MPRYDQRQNRSRITLHRNNAAVRYAALFCILNGNGAHFVFCGFAILFAKHFLSGG
ncbi:hypothetical protein KCP71_23135 [Salmonella enterica subsp. enterica]|nr:hypothetical protein KCP71_23135 [Salmonella enterica subsp. enterica]